MPARTDLPRPAVRLSTATPRIHPPFSRFFSPLRAACQD
ncbi:hypothetical protein ATPR_0003 [Acetobacter tropicalis NBRC 101654]|uniref:Uncharacterized protein n=1 Tax=Acetobacter tropicalis NBRC 101654 TaxID=749388 RepID=F7V9F4_9PROT|nr:hypothetical protein ATPR_0003 [Acetobacter tropicalis NBRC 101654]